MRNRTEAAIEPASPVRRRVFLGVMWAAPVAFFALIELILLLAGFGGEPPLFVPLGEHPEYLIPNPDVGQRYFTQSSLVPAPPHDAFLATKSAGTLRLFVQGGSTAAGFPYGHGGMFSRMLRQRLVQTFPGRSIEVVNTSMAAVNSHTLLDFSREILDQEPDVVLIYAGHNEYYGAYGVASMESPAAGRLLVRLYLTLDRFRVVQGLRRLAAALSNSTRERPEGTRSEGSTLMEEMAGDRTIAIHDRLFQRGVEQFRGNMTDLLCRYRDAGVPVFIGTLVANERHQRPFVSGLLARTNPRDWEAKRDRARALLSRNDTLGALRSLDELVRLDTTSADAFFERGQVNAALSRFNEARADFRRAKDLDELRFRAPETLNEALHEAAERCGAVVVDVRNAFAGASPDGIPGNNLLFEHVHPNIGGAFLLADAFYGALHEAQLGGPWPAFVPSDRARREILVTPLDSTLASWHIRRLLNNWPFQKQGVTRADTLEIATLVDSLALEVIRGASWADATATLGARFESRGELRSALQAALALADEMPYLSMPYLLAANILVKQQRFSTALQYYTAADEREPSLEARLRAGTLLVRAGRFAEAIPWLQKTLLLDSNHRSGLYNLALSYAATGRSEEARPLLERLLQLEPAAEPARRLLERIEGERN